MEIAAHILRAKCQKFNEALHHSGTGTKRQRGVALHSIHVEELGFLDFDMRFDNADQSLRYINIHLPVGIMAYAAHSLTGNRLEASLRQVMEIYHPLDQDGPTHLPPGSVASHHLESSMRVSKPLPPRRHEGAVQYAQTVHLDIRNPCLSRAMILLQTEILMQNQVRNQRSVQQCIPRVRKFPSASLRHSRIADRKESTPPGLAGSLTWLRRLMSMR